MAAHPVIILGTYRFWVCFMKRRMKTHIRLGIRLVSPSDQSSRCPHEETLGPYLPIAKFRGVSPRNFAEKTLGEIIDFYFSPRKIISRMGCSAAKREKGAFFLGWSVHTYMTEAYLYYKFTYEPKGSGELKNKNKDYNKYGNWTPVIVVGFYPKITWQVTCPLCFWCWKINDTLQLSYQRKVTLNLFYLWWSFNG